MKTGLSDGLLSLLTMYWTWDVIFNFSGAVLRTADGGFDWRPPIGPDVHFEADQVLELRLWRDSVSGDLKVAAIRGGKAG